MFPKPIAVSFPSPLGLKFAAKAGVVIDMPLRLGDLKLSPRLDEKNRMGVLASLTGHRHGLSGGETARLTTLLQKKPSPYVADKLREQIRGHVADGNAVRLNARELLLDRGPATVMDAVTNLYTGLTGIPGKPSFVRHGGLHLNDKAPPSAANLRVVNVIVQNLTSTFGVVDWQTLCRHMVPEKPSGKIDPTMIMGWVGRHRRRFGAKNPSERMISIQSVDDGKAPVVSLASPEDYFSPDRDLADFFVYNNRFRHGNPVHQTSLPMVERAGTVSDAELAVLKHHVRYRSSAADQEVNRDWATSSPAIQNEFSLVWSDD